LKQQSKSVLQMPGSPAGIHGPAAAKNPAWTLVDFLFPAERAPVWTGSVRGEPEVVLAKTA
jgi:hypothetical protein